MKTKNEKAVKVNKYDDMKSEYKRKRKVKKKKYESSSDSSDDSSDEEDLLIDFGDGIYEASQQQDEEDEKRIRKQDKSYRDKIIRMKVGKHETVLECYHAWLNMREKLYPYDAQSMTTGARHVTLYRRRYSLLSPMGRYREWVRTAFRTKFDVRLYGLVANRWYKYFMQKHGDSTISEKQIRKVKLSELKMPQFSYDELEDPLPMRSREDNDLPERSLTLNYLPLALQFVPPSDESAEHFNSEWTIEDFGRRFITQMKRKNLWNLTPESEKTARRHSQSRSRSRSRSHSRPKSRHVKNTRRQRSPSFSESEEEESSNSAESDPDSSSDEDDKSDVEYSERGMTYPCRRCECIITRAQYVKFCYECTQFIKNNRLRYHEEQGKRNDALGLPPLQTVPSSSTSQQSPSTPINVVQPSSTTYTISPIATSTNNNHNNFNNNNENRNVTSVNQTASVTVPSSSSYTYASTSSSSSPQITSNAPIMNVAPMTYIKQEEELKAIKEQTKEVVRINQETPIEVAEESASTLGNILSEFDLSTRNMFRSNRNITYTNREIMAAIAQTITHLGHFKGESTKAPEYLLKYCIQVQRYKFDCDACIQILQDTFTDMAKTWLNVNWAECGKLPKEKKPIQLLLHRFRNKWMGVEAARLYRSQLRNIKLTSDTASKSDLQTHYTSYVTTLQNLHLCDKNVNQAEVNQEYFDSLPTKVATYIGSEYEKCTSLDELHHLAERAMDRLPTQAKARQDGELPRTITNFNGTYMIGNEEYALIPVNAITDKSRSSSSSSSSSSKSNKPKNSSNDNNNKHNNDNRTHHKSKKNEDEEYDSQVRKKTECYHCGEKGHYTGKCQFLNKPQLPKGVKLWAARSEARGFTFAYDKDFYIDLARKHDARRASYSSSSSSSSAPHTPSSSSSHRRGKSSSSQSQPSKNAPVLVDSDSEAEL